MRTALLAALLVACSGSPPRPPSPRTAPTELADLIGSWRSADGSTSETWVAVGDHRVGIGFVTRGKSTDFFDVMIIHGDVLTAMPAGQSQVDFPRARSWGDLRFRNPEHDDPTELVYRRRGDQLRVTVVGPRGERVVEMTATSPTSAPILAANDRAFAADSARRGGAAWAERFTADGANWTVGSQRREGPRAIADMIDGLAARQLTLRWQPDHSGSAPAGDMGFTAGRYQVVDGSGAEVGTGTYVSVWRRQDDGRWLLVFDSGVADPVAP